MDREKIIKGLECCLTLDSPCGDCPYYSYEDIQDLDCERNLRHDAVSLLKGQEDGFYEKGVSLMKKTSEMLSVADVQGMLGLSRQGAYNLVNRPDFPTVRAGKKLLIPVKAFDEWVQNGWTRRENKKQDQ